MASWLSLLTVLEPIRFIDGIIGSASTVHDSTPKAFASRRSKAASDFPRNTPPNLAQYMSERPDMSSHGEKSEKAKTMKRNNTYENDIKK